MLSGLYTKIGWKLRGMDNIYYENDNLNWREMTIFLT